MMLKDKRPYLYFFGSIKWELLTLLALAILVGELDDNVYLLQNFSLAIPAFLGTCIVVALAFRTNEAYQRWWEAKQIWEGISNCTRSWTRMVFRFFPEPNQESSPGLGLKDKLINRQFGWNYVLTARLRELPPLEGAEDYLDQADLDFLATVDNPTQGILLLQGLDLKAAFDRGEIPIYQHIELEETLRLLEAYMGKAERIKKTHFPVLYDMIAEAGIYIFCILMCYFVSDGYTWFEAGISFLLSAIFMSLTKIAQDMQDPFEGRPSDTPMTAISKQLERSALQVMGEDEIPHPHQPAGFYLN